MSFVVEDRLQFVRRTTIILTMICCGLAGYHVGFYRGQCDVTSRAHDAKVINRMDVVDGYHWRLFPFVGDGIPAE